MNKTDRTYYINIRKKLESNLKPDRYEHSLGVEFMSAALAMAHGVNIEKAETAGLLHDCAKTIHNEKPYSHAFKGPEVAHDMYGIDDPEILSAIKWHTTGKKDMTDLEKIVFIADYIEPSREHREEMDEIREVAFQDLTKAVYLISKHTIEYLTGKKADIEPHTIECFKYLEETGKYDK